MRTPTVSTSPWPTSVPPGTYVAPSACSSSAIMNSVIFARFATVPLLAATLLTLGCHAQLPAGAVGNPAAAAVPAGTPLSPELQRKVEVMLRQKANLPPETSVTVGGV